MIWCSSSLALDVQFAGDGAVVDETQMRLPRSLSLAGTMMRMVSMGTKMRALVPLFPSRPTFATMPMILELNAVQQHGLTQRRAAGKDILQQFPADDGDAAAVFDCPDR